MVSLAAELPRYTEVSRMKESVRTWAAALGLPLTGAQLEQAARNLEVALGNLARAAAGRDLAAVEPPLAFSPRQEEGARHE